MAAGRKLVADEFKWYDIPLDAPLEPSMEDAIVTADRPTFSFNTQAVSSGMLGNSIKYEGDGIACGWYHHEVGERFEYEANTDYDGSGAVNPSAYVKRFSPWYRDGELVAMRVEFTDGSVVVVGMDRKYSPLKTSYGNEINQVIRVDGDDWIEVFVTTSTGKSLWFRVDLRTRSVIPGVGNIDPTVYSTKLTYSRGLYNLMIRLISEQVRVMLNRPQIETAYPLTKYKTLPVPGSDIYYTANDVSIEVAGHDPLYKNYGGLHIPYDPMGTPPYGVTITDPSGFLSCIGRYWYVEDGAVDDWTTDKDVLVLVDSSTGQFRVDLRPDKHGMTVRKVAHTALQWSDTLVTGLGIHPEECFPGTGSLIYKPTATPPQVGLPGVPEPEPGWLPYMVTGGLDETGDQRVILVYLEPRFYRADDFKVSSKRGVIDASKPVISATPIEFDDMRVVQAGAMLTTDSIRTLCVWDTPAMVNGSPWDGSNYNWDVWPGSPPAPLSMEKVPSLKGTANERGQGYMFPDVILSPTISVHGMSLRVLYFEYSSNWFRGNSRYWPIELSPPPYPVYDPVNQPDTGRLYQAEISWGRFKALDDEEGFVDFGGPYTGSWGGNPTWEVVFHKDVNDPWRGTYDFTITYQPPAPGPNQPLPPVETYTTGGMWDHEMVTPSLSTYAVRYAVPSDDGAGGTKWTVMIPLPPPPLPPGTPTGEWQVTLTGAVWKEYPCTAVDVPDPNDPTKTIREWHQWFVDDDPSSPTYGQFNGDLLMTSWMRRKAQTGWNARLYVTGMPFGGPSTQNPKANNFWMFEQTGLRTPVWVKLLNYNLDHGKEGAEVSLVYQFGQGGYPVLAGFDCGVTPQTVINKWTNQTSGIPLSPPVQWVAEETGPRYYKLTISYKGPHMSGTPLISECEGVIYIEYYVGIGYWIMSVAGENPVFLGNREYDVQWDTAPVFSMLDTPKIVPTDYNHELSATVTSIHTQNRWKLYMTMNVADSIGLEPKPIKPEINGWRTEVYPLPAPPAPVPAPLFEVIDIKRKVDMLVTMHTPAMTTAGEWMIQVKDLTEMEVTFGRALAYTDLQDPLPPSVLMVDAEMRLAGDGEAVVVYNVVLNGNALTLELKGESACNILFPDVGYGMNVLDNLNKLKTAIVGIRNEDSVDGVFNTRGFLESPATFAWLRDATVNGRLTEYFRVNGVEYFVSINLPSIRGYLGVSSFDMRDGSMKESSLGRIEEGITCIHTPFISDDVETLGFYWIDRNHIFEYNDDYCRIWEGDPTFEKERWTVISEILTVYFVKDGLSLQVTSCSGEEQAYRPWIILLGAEDERWWYTMTRLDTYDLLTIRGRLDGAKQYVTMGYVFGPGNYPTTAMMTFMGSERMSMSALILNSVFTSYGTGNTVLLGIKYDNGFNQWTLSFDNGAFVGCLHCYGSVGPTGEATGGAIPAYCFDSKAGFKAALQDLTVRDTLVNRVMYSKGAVYFENMSMGNIVLVCRYNVSSKSWSTVVVPLQNRLSVASGGQSRAGNIENVLVAWGSVVQGFMVPYAPSLAVGLFAYASSLNCAVSSCWSTTVVDEISPVYQAVSTYDERCSGFDARLYTAYKLVASIFDETAVKFEGLKPQEVQVPALNVAFDPSTIGTGENFIGKVKDGAGAILSEIKGMSKEELNAKASALADSVNAAVKEGMRTDNASKGLIAGLRNFSDYNASVLDSPSSLPYATASSSAMLTTEDLYKLSADQNVWGGPGMVQAQFVNGIQGNGKCSTSYGWTCMHCAFSFSIDGLGLDISFDIGAETNWTMEVKSSSTGNGHNDVQNIQFPFRLGNQSLYLRYPTDTNTVHTIKNDSMSCVGEIKMAVSFAIREEAKLNHAFSEVKYVTSASNGTLSGRWSVVQGTQGILKGIDPKFPLVLTSGKAVFTASGLADYCIIPDAKLWYSAVKGMVQMVSVDDTVVMDGVPNNVLYYDDGELLLSSSYNAVRVGQYDQVEDLRCAVVSADVFRVNKTGLNAMKGNNAMHGFDGYTDRTISLVGDEGNAISVLNMVSTLVDCGATKTASIVPATQYLGKFNSYPLVKYNYPINVFAKYLGNTAMSKENLYAYRFSVPVNAKVIRVLPAHHRTRSTYKLMVIDGITSLVTDLRNVATHKIPNELEFVINTDVYRMSADYISRVTQAKGVVYAEDKVACIGLEYIGSTTAMAWLYSPSNREFFTFDGEQLKQVAEAFRFKDVIDGEWDQVRQEIVFRSTLERGLNTLVRCSETFDGMLYKPNKTISTGDWDYKYYGLSGGVAMQGMSRFQVNNFVIREPMVDITDPLGDGRGIIHNVGKWKRVKGERLEDFWSERDYGWQAVYGFNKAPELTALGKPPVLGYYYEPFKCATSFIGTADRTDSQFKWRINFGMTDLLRKVWGRKYIQVNVTAETMSTGGTVAADRVQHFYLKTDMFTRTSGNNGYYMVEYDSNNGFGSEEKLYIWSDGLLYIRSLAVGIREVTEVRASPLVTRPDVQELEEL